MKHRSGPFGSGDHRPFSFDGGSDAALLIHGFGGTPAEMRPLGAALRDAGWAVDAPLLPGFGPDIENLAERTHREWIDTVASRYRHLRCSKRRILFVGNSMGGALALAAAAASPPAGLVLLAPFTRFASKWQDRFWPLIRRLCRDVRPFADADLTAPEMRRMIARMIDGGTPDDPAVASLVRAIRLPIAALDQLRRAGRAGTNAAASIRAPVLVLQGTGDAIVTPAATRELYRRLPPSATYVEVDGRHDLPEPDAPAWAEVQRRVLAFAAATAGSPG